MLGSLIYDQAIEITKNEVMTNNANMLGQVREVLDVKLREIDNITKKMIQEPTMNSVINIDLVEGSASYYKVYELVNKMPDYRLSNEILFDYFIFLRDSDTTISSNSAFGVTEAVYGKAIGDMDMDYDDFNDYLWGTYHNYEFSTSKEFVVNGNKKNIISITQSLPYGYRTKYKAAIMFLLDESTIVSMLERIDVGKSGLVYLRNGQGDTVISIPGEESDISPETITEDDISNGQYLNSKNEEMIILTESSRINDWSYVAVINSTYILSKIAYIKDLTVKMVFGSLLVVTFIALFFSYYNIRPIKRIATSINRLLEPEEGSTSDYELIEKGVSKLIESNNLLVDEVKSQSLLIRNTYLGKIVNGDSTKDDINKFLSLTKDIKSDSYVQCLIMSVDGYDNIVEIDQFGEVDTVFVYVVDEMKRRTGSNVFYYRLNKESVVLLIISDQYRADKIMLDDVVKGLYDLISLEHMIQSTISIGNIHKGLENTYISFREAKYAMEYNQYREIESIIHYEDIPESNSENFYYPIDVEMRLISLIKSGDTDEVKQLLKAIYEENFELRGLSLEMTTQLVYSMKSTMIRGFANLSTDDELNTVYKELDDAQTVDEIFNNVIRYSYAFSHFIRQRSEDQIDGMVDLIKRSIEQNYTSSLYDLVALASEMKVSKAYIYQFIKQNFGVTFADYIEKKRMDHACERLLETDDSIAEIAEAVGYNSDMTFRRAFKRVMRITPSKFRNAAK